MTSAHALVDAMALLLFQNIREGMGNGRISDIEAARTEVDAAIAELDRRWLIEGPKTHLHDLVSTLVVEVSSLHEKVAKCESQLAEFQSSAELMKQETSQIAARTEACNLLVEEQRKENAKVLAAMEGNKSGTTASPFVAPAATPIDPILRPAPSRSAVVSFPGGPRTITIHPPDSPSYQSIIRDEKGDVIINLKGPKPLRREGAFRRPLEDIDWRELTRVPPPVPRWPDRFQPSSCPPPSRVPVPQNLARAQSSSSDSLLDSEDAPFSNPDVLFATPATSSASPSFGRGKKRARNDEEGADGERREDVPLALTLPEPTTPTPVRRDASNPPDGPTKPKKPRLSASSETLTAAPLSRTRSLLDVTRSD